MNKTFRFRIFLQYILLLFIVLLAVLPANYYYFNRREKIIRFNRQIDSLYMLMLHDIQVQNDFFTYEITNPRFFTTGQSFYIKQHEDLYVAFNDKLDEIKSIPIYKSVGFNLDLDIIQKGFDIHHGLFLQMIDLVRKRGYKDWGIVGEMRANIHQIEKAGVVEPSLMLSLRRHEKDYIIRNEIAYIEKLNKLGKEVKAKILNHHHIHKAEKEKQLQLLDNYIILFNELVYLDRHIGIRDNTALKAELGIEAKHLQHLFGDLISKANQVKGKMFIRSRLYYVFFLFGIIILVILMSVMNARRITRPLERFAEYIKYVKNKNFKLGKKAMIPSKVYEISLINQEFNSLLEKLERRESQRNIAQKALKDSELKYRELSDLLPISIFETNVKGKLSYVNKEWFQAFGYTKRDYLQGIYFQDIIENKAVKNMLSQVTIYSGKHLALKKDGNTFPVLLYANRVCPSPQDGAGYRGAFVDITEREKHIQVLEVQKRKAEEADNLKSAFLANMSHEIRTPMNAILGFSELLKDEGLDPGTRKEYIKYINSNGECLLNLIDDIIDIAKIEAGQLKTKKKPCSINNILEELFVSCQEIMNKQDKPGVNLLLNKEKWLKDLVIHTDPYRFKQIFLNLIMNAIKFTEKGFIEFGYCFNEHLEFYVKDTGIGMPSDKADLVFDRFYKLEESPSRIFGGAGLGLSITRHLVHILGGEIWVNSTQGTGSVFYFTLPYELVSPVPPGYKSSSIKAEHLLKENIFNGLKILIVEDDDMNILLLKKMLRKTGACILVAKNGLEATRVVEGNPGISLILMDVKMPGIDGYEATRQIKEKYPGIKIIMQTAYAISGENEKAHEAGADDYISKPLNKYDLLGKIESVNIQKHKSKS